MDNRETHHWHSMAIDECVSLLRGDIGSGLTMEEIVTRRAHYGENRISVRKERGAFYRFVQQINQPLVIILVVSGLIVAGLREWVDAGVIFGVVLVNATVGYLQESKAVNALAALSRTMTTMATVVRQGEKVTIPATELVPGDTVVVQSGDKVPADMRLGWTRNLSIAEAALTGESVPVAKDPAPLGREITLADRHNMLYASTLVTTGQGIGIVTATGDATEVGRISHLIADAIELATPLTRKISEFSALLLRVILGLAALTVAIGLWRGQPFTDIFMAAVALAVGAIPEGLPAAVTVTLAIGVARMARRRAIIRKLPAVETLGSTTVICTDKTGTLTENQMTVQEVLAGGAFHTVGGSGYNPHAGAIAGGSPALTECLRAGMLCNDSVLLEQEGRWQVQGDPTEGALLTAAHKGGLGVGTLAEAPRLDSVPFESEYQYMATLHAVGPGKSKVIYCKGAVEPVLARCHGQLDASGGLIPLQTEEIYQAVEAMAGRGLRVLAFARKEALPATESIGHESVADGLVFLGLQGMIDPPRPEAVAAVSACLAAGIRVAMITGDHPGTAAAIARQIGLGGPDWQGVIPVLTGRQLAAIPDNELIARAEGTMVFARATPEQKLRLVKALQANGHVVAMTGDGVNDAPALKMADIGVAMGITGTEVAKEAADMVLTDDNFSAIEAAVEEGRGVFDNLIKFIVWTLPTNLGEGLIILTAIVFGVTLPILPVQILWINMTTAGFLGLTLAFEPKEAGIMRRPPRRPEAPIVDGRVGVRIVLVSLLMLAAGFGLFLWELSIGASLGEARTAAVNAFVMIELCYLFNCRTLKASAFELGFFSNPWVIGGVIAMGLLQVLYTYLPWMNRLFQSVPLAPDVWGRAIAAGMAVFVLIEMEKGYWRRKGDAR